MDRVLVIGGTGALGRAIVPALVAAGYRVAVLALSDDGLCSRAEFVQGSRHDLALLHRLANEGRFDGIVDLVAYGSRDVRPVVEAWRDVGHSLQRLVLLSSLAAVGAFRVEVASEESAIRAVGPEGDYASGKAAGERVLEEAASFGFPGVILRAAPIFGPNDPVSRENYVVQRLLLGHPIPLLAPEDTRLIRVFSEDLVQPVLSALSRPIPPARVYHLVQPERITYRQYIAAIAHRVGRPALMRPVDSFALCQSGLNAAAFPLGPGSAAIRFDIERAVSELGFAPTPFPRALEATLSWLLEQPPLQAPAWPGRNSTQSRLAGTHELLQLERERYLWSGEPLRIVEDDDVLAHVISGKSAEQWSVTTASAWRDASQTDGKPELRLSDLETVVIPERLRDWVAADLPPPPDCDKPRLQAVIEPAAHAQGEEYWFYSAARARKSRGYGLANAPLVLRPIPFSEFTVSAPPSSKERLLLTVRDRKDAEALQDWLLRWNAEGEYRVDDLEASARIFLTDAQSWSTLSGGRGWLAEFRASLAARAVDLGRWCAVFELCREQLRGAAELESPSPWLFDGKSLRPI